MVNPIWTDVLQNIQSSFSPDIKNISLDLTDLFFRYVGLKEQETLFGEEKPLLDASCLAGADVISDISSLGRNVLSAFSIKSPLTSLLGESAILTAWTGSLLYKKGEGAYEEAAKGVLFQDETGKLQESFCIYRGVVQVISGLSLVLSRSTSLFLAFGDKGGRLKGVSLYAGIT